MPRRGRVIKREIPPDAKYHNVTLAKLINKELREGKKSTAEKIVYDAMAIIEKQESKEPAMVVEQAVRNSTPQLEVKSRRIGGATYQVPIEVRPVRSLSLALSWLVTTDSNRSGTSPD